jgi:hypothetical protein
VKVWIRENYCITYNLVGRNVGQEKSYRVGYSVYVPGVKIAASNS